LATREDSLKLMRERMFTAEPLGAAFFIGGMEGVIDEYGMISGGVARYPVGSTGGAARELLRRSDDYLSAEDRQTLLHDLDYSPLFRRLLLRIEGIDGERN
jgi:hypothetical protein